ncbi:hypothetical protein BST61_g2749 [Cercospora zeina]
MGISAFKQQSKHVWWTMTETSETCSTRVLSENASQTPWLSSTSSHCLCAKVSRDCIASPTDLYVANGFCGGAHTTALPSDAALPGPEESGSGVSYIRILKALLPLLFVVQVLAGPVVRGTCARVAPMIQLIAAYPSSTPFCSSWLAIKTRTSTSTVRAIQSTTTTMNSITATSTFAAAASTSTAPGVVQTAPTRTTTLLASPTTITQSPIIVEAEATTITLTADSVDETGTLTITITDPPVTSTAPTRLLIAKTVTATITAATFTDDSQTTTIFDEPFTTTVATQTLTAATSSVTLTADASTVTDGTLTITADRTITITEPTRIVTADSTTIVLVAIATSITAEPITSTLETLVVTAEPSTLILTADPASVAGETSIQTATSYTTLSEETTTTYTAPTSVVSVDAITYTSTRKTTITTVGFQRRQAKTIPTPPATSTIPQALRTLAAVARSVISSACSCFNIPTPTTTQFGTTTSLTTIPRTAFVVANLTTTPIIVLTLTRTETPEATDHQTPSVLVTPPSYGDSLINSILDPYYHNHSHNHNNADCLRNPSSYKLQITATAHETPLHTEHVTPIIRITALTTSTPSAFITLLSTEVPEATEYTTPTITVTPTSTYTPTIFVTPLSTTIPEATSYTTPTIYITTTSTTTPLATIQVTPGTTVTPLSTVTPPTTIVTLQTIRVSPAPVANCASDGTIYTARDGSNFIFTCREDISGFKMPGVAIAVANNFESCIDRCVNEGSKCLAARWLLGTRMCELKSKAAPIRFFGGTTAWVAVRQTISTGTGSTGVITNGDFSNGLNSWTPYGMIGFCGNIPWSATNGMASVFLPPCQNGLANYLRSTLTLDAGVTFSMSAEISMTVHDTGNGRVNCIALLDGLALSDPYLNLPLPATGQTRTRSIVAAGQIPPNGAQPFSIGFNCDSGTRAVTIAFDNIKISTLASEAGSSPTELIPTQILINGDFSRATLDPWTAYPGLRTNQTVTLLDGVAIAQFSPMDNRISGLQQLGIYQTNLLPRIDAGQTGRLTGKVTIEYSGDLYVSCQVQCIAGSTLMYSSPTVRNTTTFEIDVRKTMEYDGTDFYAVMRCFASSPNVPATPRAVVDDFALTLNPS